MNLKVLSIALLIILSMISGCFYDTSTEDIIFEEGHKIDISYFSFEPQGLIISPGTTVTWTNDDLVVHTIIAEDGSFKSEVLEKGDIYNHTFTEPGEYPYYCDIHPSMRGTILVEQE